MITNRQQVTDMIVSAKVSKGITWAEVASAVGLSKEWTTAACLGQMSLDKTQAETVGKIFDLSDEAIAWLQIVPYKGSLPTAVPTRPADLPLVRGGECLWLYHQGADSRGVW